MSDRAIGPAMQTLGDFLAWAEGALVDAGCFYGHGTNNAWDEAVAIAIHVLELPPDVDASTAHRILNQTEIQQLQAVVHKRTSTRKPLAYILGEAWFQGERYKVTGDVLVPRSPIGELIASGFASCLNGATAPRSLLDLCTGSGCLAIAAAKQFTDCKVDAVDISPAALKVANENVALHACNRQVQLYESDLFDGLPKHAYDIVISNPPYVSAESMLTLPLEYQFEPKIALQTGASGLALTHRILSQAADYLAPHGLLIVEVGESQAELSKTYPTAPFKWLEFAHGGNGVFLLTKAQLVAHQHDWLGEDHF